MPPVTEMLGKCGRWDVRCFHLSQECRESVPGGRYDVSTCRRNAGKVCPVDAMLLPPVTEMLGKCGRWTVRCCYLSRKCGKSVAGGRCDVATCHGNAAKVRHVDAVLLLPVTEMWEKCGRWTVRCSYLSRKCRESVSGGRCDVATCHGNAAKVRQVDAVLLLPVTEMLRKYAKWEIWCFHLSRKCGESVTGGRYDDATCHGNAGKVCQVDGAIAGLELPDRNIAYLNLPDRNITYLKFPTGKLHV